MSQTGVTVRELLRLPILKDARVLSGAKGLDRVVRYIDIMEIPEIKGWLREGELLLTTAYAIRHDPSLLPKLVEDLAQAGAAALAFKPERFIHQVPAEMISVSNEFGLPVIAIPVGIPSIDITHSVMELVLDRQTALLRRAEEIHKKLTTLVLENRGIQVVADSVAELINASVCVTDTMNQVIVESPLGWDILAKPNLLTWDVVVDKQVAGKLFVDKVLLDDMEQVCVDQARVVFSLELMRRKTALETELRLRGDFVDELLSDLPPEKNEVLRKGRQLDLDPEMLWEVVLVENIDFNTRFGLTTNLTEYLVKEGQQLGLRPNVELRGERVLLFLPSKPVALASNVQTKIKNHGFTWIEVLHNWAGKFESGSCIRFGVGRKYSLWDIYQSYSEAKKALVISNRIFLNQRLVSFEEIEVYQIISDFGDTKTLATAFERRFGALRLYDKEHSTDLIKTLYVYLESGCSSQETANRLFIHRNSVKYRLERIKEICNLDIDSAQQRFVYHLCLTWYFLKGID